MGNSPSDGRSERTTEIDPLEGDLRRLTSEPNLAGSSGEAPTGQQCVMLSQLPVNSETPNSNPANYEVFCFGNKRKDSIFVQCKGGENAKVGKQFTLGKQYTSFRTEISVNDTAHASEVGSSSSPIVFEVSGYKAGQSSWKALHKSRPISTRNDMYSLTLDVHDLEGLQIACWCEGRLVEHSHAVWVDPRLYPKPDAELAGLTLREHPQDNPSNVSRVHYKGWMDKKGDDLLGLWSSRFFVLDGHVLRWFTDDASYSSNGEANGHLHLNDVSGIRQWKNKPQLIHLETAGRTYMLKCSSGEDAWTWVGLWHYIGQLEDPSLRRSSSTQDEFKNQFKVHAVTPSGGLSNSQLHFDEHTGVSCEPDHWSAHTKDIHGFVKVNGGNGNRFALVTYSYKEFEGASQVQLKQIQASLSTLKGNREKPAISRSVQVFKQASLNLFEDAAEFLAKGGYGKVFKVKEKATGDFYALKVIEVGRKFDKEFIESSIKEREVLVGIAQGNPFLVSLHSVWQENLNVFFCLELAEAGDLTNVMKSHYRDQLPPALAGFYFAEVINVLRFMHARGIVYRDLKPENLLVSAEGHIKLTDFGLAKQGLNDSNMTEGCTTFKGTPEYYAPEVLQAGQKDGHTYGLAADWWAVGILFFEMHAGLYTTPFPSGVRDPGALNRMYNQILTREFSWPDPLPPWASNFPLMRQLISGLLVKDPQHRLGTPAPGLKARSGDSIKEHPYFQTELPRLLHLEGPVDIDQIDKTLMTPPWLPEVSTKERAKQSLSVFRGSASDDRLGAIGSWDGNHSEVTEGPEFLKSMGFR